ncbi:alkaline phosphatase-like [Teleopsis dalmanni]|uniref:alkaline phosphatase-like n=1 Tax=Teleopsis dalmanni TaxID=139649 RepID=UPI0018CC8931|nr:alkaline phosphatase-like [Teleopsis dalmanni]
MTSSKTDVKKLPNSPQHDSIEVQMDSLDSSHGFSSPIEDTKLTKPRVFKSKVFVAAIIFSSVLIIIMCIGFLIYYEFGNDETDPHDLTYWHLNLPAEQKIWYDKGIDELKSALNQEINRKRARNVILFVGDGMGPNTVTAARIYGFKEEGVLSWEQFPHMGMLKTYCADKQVPDSFSTATALFGGVKTNYETGGLDSSVALGNCSADALNSAHHIQTILKWAQIDGMNTGFVTTTRVTHATPAALYAHSPDRRWECESTMSDEAKTAGCTDIARQLIETETGKNINVIMGGGRQMLVSDVEDSAADPIDTWAGKSNDGRNLIEDWKQIKEKDDKNYAVVQNTGELNSMNTADVDYVLGIFANGHLKYEHERDSSDAGMPSLKQMTLKALEVLKSKDKGFLLVVESGLIDQAHHRGTARKALSEVLALNDAVNATIQAMKSQMDDTLIIVTSDHAHSLTINGHPDKGADILGTAMNSKTEGTAFTTLTYGTSYKGFHADDTGKRVDPSTVDTTDWDYTQQAAINTDENLHGGTDVAIHAKGAMSYLFHGMHEQSYVAHVISYALRIGRFRDSSIAESLAELMPL